MRVIVTRPQHSAGRTAERLKTLGHVPIMLPLTRATHDPQAAEHALAKPHGALAITSAEAPQVLSSLGRSLDPFLDEPLFAVGQASASAAEALGFRQVCSSTGTGAALADLIAGHSSRFSDPLLYLAGRPRSSRFEEGLRVQGVPVTVAEIYRMLPIAYEQNALDQIFHQAQPDVVLIYSRENARLFFQLAARHMEALQDLLIIGISDSVTEAVPQHLRSRIKIAEHPEEDGLFALL